NQAAPPQAGTGTRGTAPERALPPAAATQGDWRMPGTAQERALPPVATTQGDWGTPRCRRYRLRILQRVERSGQHHGPRASAISSRASVPGLLVTSARWLRPALDGHRVPPQGPCGATTVGY